MAYKSKYMQGLKNQEKTPADNAGKSQYKSKYMQGITQGAAPVQSNAVTPAPMRTPTDSSRTRKRTGMERADAAPNNRKWYEQAQSERDRLMSELEQSREKYTTDYDKVTNYRTWGLTPAEATALQGTLEQTLADQKRLQSQIDEVNSRLEAADRQSWEVKRRNSIQAAGGDYLMNRLLDLARLSDLASAEQRLSKNPDAFFQTPVNSPVQDEYRALQKKLADRYGSEEMGDWMEYATRIYNQQSHANTMEQLTKEIEGSDGLAAVASGLTVPMNVLGGGAAYLDVVRQRAANMLLGKDTPIDYYSPQAMAGVLGQDIRGTVASEIEKNTAGKAGSDTAFGNLYSGAYQLGMSMADSGLAVGLSLLGVPASSALLGGSAANSTMRDAINRGATQDQALLMGAVGGLAEMFFEKYSIDNLIRMDSPKTLAQLLKNMAVQGGIEASEEGATTLANTAADLLIMGDKSQLQTSVQGYKAQGYSAEEAERLAAKDWVLGLASDMVGGFVSGGVFGGVSGTASYIANRSEQNSAPQTEQTAAQPVQQPQTPTTGETTAPEAKSALTAAQAPTAVEPVRAEAAGQTQAQEAWNQTAARAFGETGAKAFRAVNDGNMDGEMLYAGFAVYHHAGMTGRDMNSITSQYAENFPENYRKIAYDAGVADAAASVKARQEAVATATVYGKDAGLIANDYSKSMDQDVVLTLDSVAKSIGRKVVVEDLGSDTNGYLDSDGVIHVDINADNPYLVVAAHEVTHVMEDMAPAEHKRYRDYVLNAIAEANGGSILDLVEKQKKLYEEKQSLSDEQAMNELVADYTARMMKDRNLFAEFAQKDRTAAQKLLDAVKKFLQKVKAAFQGNRQAQNEAARQEFGMDISMVEEAAKLWQEALTASQAQAQTANKNTDPKAGVDVRYSKKVSGLTEADVRGLLEACINGEFPNGSYIPLRRNTPAILLEKVQEHSEGSVMAENLPIIMNVGKVRQAMDEEDGVSYGDDRPHGISTDGMIEAIKKMDDPAYIVFQPKNGRYSEVIRYRDGAGKDALAVMDFGNNKDAVYMNGYEGGTYNVLVTAYNPDDLQSYLKNNEVIYDKKKDAPQRGSGSILPSHLNGSPFADIVTQEDGKSNQESAEDKDGVVTKDDGTPVAAAYDNGIAGEDGVRYSVKGGSVIEPAAARAEDVDVLKRQLEYWKSQVKPTNGFKVNAKDVEKLAKKLIRTYKVDTDTGDFTKKLQTLYDGIAHGYYGNKEIDYEAAKARAGEISRTIVENAVETDNELYVEYAELRKYLRGITLNISAEDSQDIPDFNDFRKRNMGRMRIGTNGTNIDSVYKELSHLWPEFFDETRETTPSDQLLRIAEVMEGVYRTFEVNPFGRYAEEAVSDIADEVLAYFFTLPQAQTYADKAAAKLKQSTADARLAGQMSQGRKDAAQLRQANDQIDRLKVQLKQAKADASKLKQTAAKDAPKLQKANEKVAALEAKLKQATADATLAGQMAQGRRDAAMLRRSEELAANAQERAMAALEKEKQRGAEAVQKLKETQAAKTAKTREQRKAAELRGKIIRHSKDMSQKLLRPTDKKHVPEELQSAVAAVLKAINLESNRDADGQVTKRTKAFQQLREAYKRVAGEVVVDPAVISGDGEQAAAGPLLQAVLDMGDIRIADMNSSQLDSVWRVLKAMEQSVRKANKLFLSAKYETISEMASQLQTDSAFRRPKKALKVPKVLGSTGNLTLDLEIPLTFFSQYGDVGAAVYKELRDAQDYQERLIDQLADQVGKIVTPKQVREMQKEVHTFKTEGGVELKLTTAHIMELYELSKRKQAEDHLLEGGVVQPEIQSAKIDRGTDMIALTATDLGEIISKLTDDQKQIADALQGLLTTTLADAGNRASMQAYGYKKFNDTDYWPIKSAKEALHHSEEKNANNTRSIKNIGLAQQVVPHANTALNLGGIFQTFAGHATDMIDYAAWLCPMEDANRLFNYKYKDAMGVPTGKTVKGILDKVGGNGAQTYWSELMGDIQNGIGGFSDSAIASLASGVSGNVKGASVGANIRVVVQQPTAIFRAAAVLSPVNLSKGMAKGVTKGNGWKKALAHSDIAKRKDRGGFEIGNPMQMAEILFDDRTGLARFNDKMSWAAAKADAVTWGKIWNACEWQVHGQNKALQPGSEAFYQKTAELFADVINQSQVVDGVLQRSHVMRSSNQIAKQATAFMGEPTMSLNMLMRAYDSLRYEQDPPKRGKAIKQAARVSAALLVTDVMTALAQSLVDGLRDDDRDKKYKERILTAFTGVTGDEESTWDKAVGIVLSGNLASTMNPVGRLPYAKDILSLIQGYSVERMDISAIGDFIDACATFLDSLIGDGTKTWAYATKQLATAGSKVVGISAANILRDVWSIARSVAIETGNIPLQYEMEKAIHKIGNEKNDSRYIDILYDAMNSDEEAYRAIYADMIKNGMSALKISQGIEKRMKKDQGVESVEDLTSRYLTPDQEKEYDKAYGRVTGTQVWKSATEEQREKLEDNLYDLTVGNGAGEDLREKIEPGKDVGIDEVEYLLYKLAQEVVSEDGNKNTNQSEAEAAAELLTGLSKEEQAWLWQSTNKGWKPDNNPFN